MAQRKRPPARIFEKLAQAETCWFSSVRADGRAHLAPVWYVWHNQRVYVVTQATSVRARNIQTNPSVSVALPDPVNVVILEGTARTAPEVKAEVQPLFVAKYNWDIATDAEYSMVIEMTPHKLIAWGADGEGRWRLNQESVAGA